MVELGFKTLPWPNPPSSLRLWLCALASWEPRGESSIITLPVSGPPPLVGRGGLQVPFSIGKCAESDHCSRMQSGAGHMVTFAFRDRVRRGRGETL